MFICIEGNIGVGKSTLLNILQEKYIVFQEPVHLWTRLGDMYEGQKGVAFLLQMQILNSQIDQLKEIKKLRNNNLVFMERSTWASKKIFFPLQKVSDIERQAYIMSYNNVVDTVPDVVIYLRLEPEKCLERIIKRNRHEEKNITLEYIAKVHESYEYHISKCKYPVITVICKEKTSLQIAEELITKINVFM